MLDFSQNLFDIVETMSNFLFLKKNNENLFNIISEAEKLFRDEYFEQSMVQTRRFGENLCKDLLQDKVSPDDTFDTIINKIKDNSFGNLRMKEFAEDLYFLKKHGNHSAHSASASKNGKFVGENALECLERAYEIAIAYSNTKYGYDKKLDKSVFSEEMLMTGKITGKKSSPKVLKQQYSDELQKSRTKPSKTIKAKPKKLQKPQKIKPIQQTGKKPKPKKKNKNKTKGKKIFFVLLSIAILIALIYFYLWEYL